jgi:hypothetical protein
VLVFNDRSTDGCYLCAQPSEDFHVQAVPGWEFAHAEVIRVQPNDKLFRFVEARRALIDHLDKFPVSVNVRFTVKGRWYSPQRHGMAHAPRKL